MSFTVLFSPPAPFLSWHPTYLLKTLVFPWEPFCLSCILCVLLAFPCINLRHSILKQFTFLSPPLQKQKISNDFFLWDLQTLPQSLLSSYSFYIHLCWIIFFHQFHSPFYQLVQFSNFCLLWDVAVHATLKILPDTYCVILLLCLTSSNESFLNTRKCLKFTQHFTWISSPFKYQPEASESDPSMPDQLLPAIQHCCFMPFSDQHHLWVPRSSFGLASKSEQCFGWALTASTAVSDSPPHPHHSPSNACVQLLPSISACWTL